MNSTLEKLRLKELIAQQTLVKVYLQNSYLMVGKIVAADDLVIVIEINGTEKMVYKSFISTIEPCND